MFKKFSIAHWGRHFVASCRRFPIAIALLVYLTIFLFVLNHRLTDNDQLAFLLIFYPATGALLAVSMQLLTEDFSNRHVSYVTQIVAQFAWFGVSYYLSQYERFSFQQTIAVSATVATMALSVFLLCFYRKGEDVPFWNFSWRTLVAMGAGIFVGLMLCLGLLLFFQSLEWLFNIDVDSAVYMDIWTFCLVLMAPLLTMNLIPDGEFKHIYQVSTLPAFVKGVVQYLFIPLLLLYLVTLYIYAIKILMAWQLPVGWVSYLVSASMMGMVALIYLTYPLQHHQGNSFFKAVMRWMPLVMLPLLALMTVAIARRLTDYGITVSRLYVLVFNIWCYVVCIGLLIVRNKRIWWVPASFALVLFLISVGPQSIANVTQRHLLGEARRAFVASGYTQFPLTGAQYEQWLEKADSKVARSVDAKLDYLWMYYDFDVIAPLLDRDAHIGSLKMIDDVEAIESVSLPFGNSDMIGKVKIPSGYSFVQSVRVDEALMLTDDAKHFQFTVETVTDFTPLDYKFELDIRKLAEYDRSRINKRDPDFKPLLIDNGKAAMLFEQYDAAVFGDSLQSFSGYGLLFTN